MTKKQIIVKVQVPISSNVGNPPCLIYDQSRTLHVEHPYDDEIKRMMQGEVKKFFFATGIVRGKAVSLHLIAEAPWQDW